MISVDSSTKLNLFFILNVHCTRYSYISVWTINQERYLSYFSIFFLRNTNNLIELTNLETISEKYSYLPINKHLFLKKYIKYIFFTYKSRHINRDS